MLERACPHCHGSVHYESYLAQGETVREFSCINCSRTIEVKDFYNLGVLHGNCPDCDAKRLTQRARTMMYQIGFRTTA